ncbi:retron Ec48 family effector membrane protein [Pantoea ananatis]
MKQYLTLEHVTSPTLKKLIWILYAISTLGLVISIIAFFCTGIQEHYFNLDFCFSNKCLKFAFTAFSETLTILQGTSLLLGLIASIGGIIVALLSYANSVSVSALGNHIAHFKIFQEYIFIEVNRRDRVSISSFDIFKIYNSIFDKSRTGRTSISQKYIDSINGLNDIISESNNKCSKNNGTSYSYTQHQIGMISKLQNIGIHQTRLPRNDFYEVEGQILEIIGSINAEFCYTSNIPSLYKRNYI